MSRVEDALREAMRARDVEAPTAAGFRFRRPVAAPHHRFRWVPAVAVAAGVAIVIGIVVAVVPRAPGRHTTAAPTAAVLACPAARPADQHGLPRRTDELTVTDRLVPTTVPTHAVVCAYPDPSPGLLTGSRVVDAGLPFVPETLGWLPPAGPPQGCGFGPPAVDGGLYLIGLTYPKGTMWIWAPAARCAKSSNGRFATNTPVATEAAIPAYETGWWGPLHRNLEPPCQPRTGRLGQERTLVPESPLSVVVCRQATFSTSRTGTSADLRALVAAFDALPTSPDRGISLSGCDGVDQVTYLYATFTYRVGPPVTLTIASGCRPATAHNGNLQAEGASAVLPIIQRILAR